MRYFCLTCDYDGTIAQDGRVAPSTLEVRGRRRRHLELPSSNTDYSRWIRDAIKDAAVADEIALIEKNDRLSPAQSRERILSALHEHYMTPA